MPEELKNSIKAKLWDIKFNPFMSTYIFSWIYININFILILFTSDLKIEEKITKLNNIDINYTNPLWIAMAYIFLYPFAKTAFFAVGLWFKLLINKVEILIRDETPLPQEKINEILYENVKLQNNYNDSLLKLELIKDEYNKKSFNLENEFKEKKTKQQEYLKNEQNKLQKTISNQIQQQTEYLNNKIKKLEDDIITFKNKSSDLEHKLAMEKGKKQHIEKTNQEIMQMKLEMENMNKLKFENKELKKEINNFEEKYKEIEPIKFALIQQKNLNDTQINRLTNEMIKLLYIFYEDDSIINISNFKTKVRDKFGLSKSIIDLRIEELIKEILVTKIGSNIELTDSGKKILEQLFHR